MVSRPRDATPRRAAAVLFAALLVVSIPGASVPTAAASPAPDASGSAALASDPPAPRPAASGPGGTARERTGGAAFVHPAVRRRAGNGTQHVVVVLDRQPRIDRLVARRGPSGAVESMERSARLSRAPVLDALSSLRRRGAVRGHTGLWIVNAVAVEAANRRAIRRLASLPGVSAVVPDRTVTATVPADNSTRLAPAAGGPRGSVNRSPTARGRARVLLDRAGLRAPSPPPVRSGAPPAARGAADGDGLAWGVERTGVAAAWARGIDGSGVRVAVLDTGVDAEHPDLAADLADGRAFVRCRPAKACTDPWDDDNGHGTHVAGIVTGDAGTGVAPGATVVPVKVLAGSGSGRMSTVIQGVQYAVKADADVISMSLAGPGSPLLESALGNAVRLGAVPVVSAGNLGQGSARGNPFLVDYSDLLEVGDQPASYREVITVGSSSRYGAVSYFSKHGTLSENGTTYAKPEVVAPGEAINSTTPFGYGTSSGTSMAAPHVSGLVALLLEADPGLATADVKRVLASTSRDRYRPGRDVKTGAGRADVRAVSRVLHGPTTLSVSIDARRVAPGGNLTVTATLRNASGAPVPNATLDVSLWDAPPDLRHRYGGRVFGAAATTNASGVATLSVPSVGNRSNRTGTWTVAVAARDGMVEETAAVTVADTDASATVVDAAVVSRAGDAVTVELSLHRNGTPVDANLTASLYGPTLRTAATRTASTGPDGAVRVTLRAPRDPFSIYGWPFASKPGTGWGDYGVVAWFRGPGLDRHVVVRNVTTVRQAWTDLEFGDEHAWFGFSDVFTYNGRYVAGETVPYTLSTTEPNATYDLVLHYVDRSGAFTNVTLGNATTDSTGRATGSFDVPDVPGQFAVVVTWPTAVPRNGSPPLGTYDVSAIRIRRTDVTVAVGNGNGTIQPGETLTLDVWATDPGTGAAKALADLDLSVRWTENRTFARRADRHEATLNATRVGTGRYEARWTVPAGVTGGFGRVEVVARARDYNGSGPTSVGVWRDDATVHRVGFQRDRATYRPGDLVTHVIRVSDPETGRPVANATVSVRGVVGWDRGADFVAPVVASRRVATDRTGTAVVTYALRDDPLFSARDSYVQVNVTAGGASQYVQRVVPVTGSWPRLRVRALNATRLSVGRSGHVRDSGIVETTTSGTDVAVPGRRTITYEVSLGNYDASANGVGGANEVVDLIVVDTDAGVIDFRDSAYTSLELDDDGTATFDYAAAPDDRPGRVYAIASTENASAVAIAEGTTVHDPTGRLRVSTGASNVTAGDAVNVTVDGLAPGGRVRVGLVRADAPAGIGDLGFVSGGRSLAALSGDGRNLAGSLADALGAAPAPTALHGRTAPATADGSGTVTARYRVPSNAVAGGYRIVVFGTNTTAPASALEPEYVGTATVRVSGATTPPANATVTGYTVSSRNLQIGERLSVTATLANLGGANDTTTVGLYADGRAVESRTVTVPGGSLVHETFETNFTARGLHAVSVNGLPRTNLTVGVPTGDVYVTGGAGDTGERVTVSVYARNATNVTGYRANLSFDPDVVRVADASGRLGGSFSWRANDTAGWVRIAETGAAGRTDPALAAVTFEVVGASGAVAPLRLIESATVLTDANGTPLPLRFHDGRIKVADATVGLSSGAGVPGQNLTLRLSADADGVTSFETTIRFDPSVVRVGSVRGGDLGPPVSNVRNGDGWVRIAAAASEGTSNPTLARIRFRIVAGNNTTSPVSIVVPDTVLWGIDGADVREIPVARYDNGSVSVVLGEKGDANGDGSATAGDATLVLRRVVGLPTGPFVAGLADMNGDGRITSGDATLVLRAVVGLPLGSR